MGTDLVTAAIVVIGDEILSGRTKDQNIGYIADHLTAIGIQLREVRIVPDDQDSIIAAVNALREANDYVFTTGGIGPTHDDITADAIAAAFNVPIDVDERALALMKPFYEQRNMELTPARLRMARLPQGAELIENSISIAPGFVMDNVIVMAGVPRVMQVMLAAVTPKLRTGGKLLTRTIDLAHPESEIADLLGEVQKAYQDVSMGSYPKYDDGKLSVQLVLRAMDKKRLEEADRALRARLVEEGFL